MSSVEVDPALEGTSPRSSVLTDSERMAATVATMKSATSDEPLGEVNDAHEDADSADANPNPTSDASVSTDPNSKSAPEKKESEQRSTPQLQEMRPNLTPQPRSTYYLGYSNQEPPSPAAAPVAGVVPYDVGSFFQQPGTFVAHSNSFGAGPNTPLSPARPTTAMGGLPPASPLFPRMSSGGLATSNGMDARQAGPPPSPSLAYMSPSLGSAMYAAYHTGTSPEEGSTWMDSQQNSFLHGSPQVNAQGIPISYGIPMTRSAAGGRAYSFEEMLPPSMLEHDQANPTYSPYGGSQASSAGGTLFAQQQSWGYGAPPEMYANAPGSPLQPRPTVGMHMAYPGGRPIATPMAPYGQYYPVSSPGPPIQTTASNKGPDGANLFIFHIPNHFSNADMYQLFAPFGNLLSVRIMVEKDTGRSRGFGFVSYDSPASAALAIKELNGFAIGNKRLKVQHKQIRSKDFDDRDASGSYGVTHGDGSYQESQYTSALPPSGPGANQNLWYDDHQIPADGEGGETPGRQDEAIDFPNTSVGGEPSSALTSGNEASSPLESLGKLQSALPEVPGNAE
jgi:hypothetical protein